MLFAHVTLYSLASYILNGDYLEGDPIDPDKRQHLIKYKARSRAYWIVLWSLAIGYAYWLLAFEWEVPGLWTPSASPVAGSFMLFLLFVMLYLPYSVIAWTEPDPIPEIKARIATRCGRKKSNMGTKLSTDVNFLESGIIVCISVYPLG